MEAVLPSEMFGSVQGMKAEIFLEDPVGQLLEEGN